MSTHEKETFLQTYDWVTGWQQLPWAHDEPTLFLAEICAKRTAGAALDIGCGAGTDSLYLAQRGWDVTSLDFMPKALEFTQQRATEAGVKVTPVEADIMRFVKLDKDFIGKEALMAMRDSGPRKTFVSMAIDNHEAPAQPGDSIVRNGRVIGTITSAAWGYRINKNLAMGFVDPEFSAIGSTFSVEISGKVFAAEVCAGCLYDPGYERVRG